MHVYRVLLQLLLLLCVLLHYRCCCFCLLLPFVIVHLPPEVALHNTVNPFVYRTRILDTRVRHRFMYTVVKGARG